MNNASITVEPDTITQTVYVNDFIVMTPYPIEPGHTLLNIQRIKSIDWKPQLGKMAAHIAEGDNAGIVINKPTNIIGYKIESTDPSNATLSFKVFLMNSETNKQTLEHRTLRFWFSNITQNDHFMETNSAINNNLAHHLDSSRVAQDFFRDLVGTSPNDFPRNYVGFIMKLMRLLKHQYESIIRMEIELKQLQQDDQPLSRAASMDGSTQEEPEIELTCQRVLDIIESSYPDPVSINDICSTTRADQEEIRSLIQKLVSQNKISSLTDSVDLFTRSHAQQTDTKINVVRQMPKVIKSKQPVIAIITSQYCEKLAVDAMISNKDTYFRYKTEGESSSNYVYTLGNIGDYQVVSTKLPAVGNSRNALIAAGNTTTRLLGTFQQLEYIFLIGCSGGVANYTDFSSNVRLGDIVVSSVPNDQLDSNDDDNNLVASLNSSHRQSQNYIYVHCEEQNSKNNTTIRDANDSVTSSANTSAVDAGRLSSGLNSSNDDCLDNNYHYRFWCPPNLRLQQLAKELWLNGLNNADNRCWEKFIDEGIDLLKEEDVDVCRPSSDTDKLYMSLGVKDVIEVSHPEANKCDIDLRKLGRPMCHFGPIGSGKAVMKMDVLRQRMIKKFGVKAFDCEYDAVLDSIYGNRKDSYIFIRGISDYKDGRKKKEWQQYSALVAAAFMKSLIINLSSQY